MKPQSLTVLFFMWLGFGKTSYISGNIFSRRAFYKRIDQVCDKTALTFYFYFVISILFLFYFYVV